MPTLIKQAPGRVFSTIERQTENRAFFFLIAGAETNEFDASFWLPLSVPDHVRRKIAHETSRTAPHWHSASAIPSLRDAS